MTHHEQPDMERVLAESDPHLLAQMLAGATGLKTTIVHEGPLAGEADDLYAGARHAAMFALQRFFQQPDGGPTTGGEK